MKLTKEETKLLMASERAYRRGLAHGVYFFREGEATPEGAEKWYRKGMREGFRNMETLGGGYSVTVEGKPARMEELKYRQGFLTGVTAAATGRLAMQQVRNYRIQRLARPGDIRDIFTGVKLDAARILKESEEILARS
ncbi:MAG: hypothetical protein BGO34_16935 [Bacteroidia bacterium 44-10]|nr:MAG: hypothetical protein BGO34_16935 [Bacteroidia bacterium 44-10]